MSSKRLTPVPFFSDAWFALVGDILQPMASAIPSINFSLVELYPTAPWDADGAMLRPGFVLTFARGVVHVECGVPPNYKADVVVHAHWEDAGRSAQLRHGPAYDAFVAERVAAGRLSVSGSVPAPVAAILRRAHDAIADQTLPWSA